MNKLVLDRGDLISGTKAIADQLGMKPTQVRYLVKVGLLPHIRIGRKIFARRSRLVAWLLNCEKS